MPTCYGVHLVGSVPLADAETVFNVLCNNLSPWLKRVPDGETGARSQWIRWQREMLEQHPAMEVDPTTPPREFRLYDGRLFRTAQMLRFLPGTRLDTVTFETGYAKAAMSSYEIFRVLREAGKIPSDVRLQVCLPTPMAPAYMDISHPSRADFLHVYERSLLRAVQEIVDAIPPSDLSIQWDTCQEVLVFEGYFEDRPASYKEDVAAELARLGNCLPADIECGYHLCYGSPRDEHLVLPRDAGILREITEAIVAGLKRPLNFIHMPVPRDRSDDAYFAPLQDLRLPPQTDLYLGLIAEDDEMGDIARIAAAGKVLPTFGVAMECGWGRKDPERVPDLIAAHKAAMHATRP
jgi:hypothetical protein